MTFENGSRIGDYEIIAPLGAGGMGQVYKVRNLISDRLEAMKVLLPDLANQPDLADRFLREIKLLANLDHPNIAKLHTALHADNRLLMFMEFVEGISLDQKIREGRLPVDTAIDYIGQVLAALDYAHRQGVVHRDIKPANMMLTPAGTIKLLDFGIAKGTADRNLTVTGTTLGSLYYMSPEQIQGAQVDGRSDLYSVGVSLYEMVTGRRPFDGTSQFSIMNAHLEKEPVPPIELQADLPPALSELIVMSMSRDAAGRFQTAAALRNALQSMAPGPSRPAPAIGAAPAVSAAPANPVKPRSHRALWVTAGALCVVLAMVAIIELGPRKKISAQESAAPPPAQQKSQEAVPPPSPSSTPAAPAPVTQAEPATAPPPVHATSKGTSAQPPSNAARRPPAIGQTSAPSTPQEAAPAAPPPAQARQPEAAAAPVPQSDAEIEGLRDDWTKLDARAQSLHTSLDGLRQGQAAQGLSLRRDWVQASTLMDTYLGQAGAALDKGDPAAAKKALEKAEGQAEILEKGLGR